jgi:hypothetical protein
MVICVGGIFVKGVGPCLFFFSPCFCLLLLVYDFWSCLGNFITGVNSVKQQTIIDSLTLLLEIHDCCQGLIHGAAQYQLWWRIRGVVFDGGMPGYYMESLVVDHSE